jgi:hypothetical protein
MHVLTVFLLSIVYYMINKNLNIRRKLSESLRRMHVITLHNFLSEKNVMDVTKDTDMLAM